jgi:hypothetical protein
MTKRSGTAYEGKARKILSARGIFSVGLQPDASPDLIVPAYKVGLEIKSTRSQTYYPTKNPDQYFYLWNQFSEDWPGFSAYYMIYFIRTHEWKVYDMWSPSPFKANGGATMDKFIERIISEAKINYNIMKDKNEVIS